MKLFEFTYTEGGFKIRREAEERLTSKQKYTLGLAAIGGATLIALVHMVGWAALIAAGIGMLLYGLGRMVLED